MVNKEDFKCFTFGSKDDTLGMQDKLFTLSARDNHTSYLTQRYGNCLKSCLFIDHICLNCFNPYIFCVLEVDPFCSEPFWLPVSIFFRYLYFGKSFKGRNSMRKSHCCNCLAFPIFHSFFYHLNTFFLEFLKLDQLFISSELFVNLQEQSHRRKVAVEED